MSILDLPVEILAKVLFDGKPGLRAVLKCASTCHKFRHVAKTLCREFFISDFILATNVLTLDRFPGLFAEWHVEIVRFGNNVYHEKFLHDEHGHQHFVDMVCAHFPHVRHFVSKNMARDDDMTEWVQLPQYARLATVIAASEYSNQTLGPRVVFARDVVRYDRSSQTYERIGLVESADRTPNKYLKLAQKCLNSDVPLEYFGWPSRGRLELSSSLAHVTTLVVTNGVFPTSFAPFTSLRELRLEGIHEKFESDQMELVDNLLELGLTATSQIESLSGLCRCDDGQLEALLTISFPHLREIGLWSDVWAVANQILLLIDKGLELEAIAITTWVATPSQTRLLQFFDTLRGQTRIPMRETLYDYEEYETGAVFSNSRHVIVVEIA
jgi:hypothetical protein